MDTRKLSVDSSQEVRPKKVDKLASPPVPAIRVDSPINSDANILAGAPSFRGVTSPRSTAGYMRTIQRRGNTYMIKDSLPSEEDPIESDSTGRMIEDLYTEALQMSSAANRTAGIFKLLYVLSNVFLITAGLIIGILTLQGYETEITKYVAAVFAFTVSATQVRMSTFSIEKRGVLLKDISLKLRKVSRQIKALQSSDLKPKDKIRKLEDYYTEVDELDLAIFDHTVTITSSPKVPRSSGSRRRVSNDLDDEQLYESHNSEDGPSKKLNKLNKPKAEAELTSVITEMHEEPEE